MKYKIGEFAYICNVSVKTLRYYDEIDLFKPYEIDLFSGYRYYTEEQIEDIKLIMELKQAGFSLLEIRDSWGSWSDEDFLRQKEKLFLEQKELNHKIKKLDELRTRMINGKIYNEKVQNVLLRKREY